MDTQEKPIKYFCALFNREGYVLDFTNDTFANFTEKSVGISIQNKYMLSKGKSLKAYLEDESISENNKWKLVSDLFKYYEEKYRREYTPGLAKDDYIPGIDAYGLSYNSGYNTLYTKCKNILAQHNESLPFQLHGNQLKQTVFSSEYLRTEYDAMCTEAITNPTDAIGKAKELMESCCKTILDEMGMPWNNKDNFTQLCDEVLDKLQLTPKSFSDKSPINASIKAVCGSLRGIVQKVTEIRNQYGSGHGKEAKFKGLEKRHAQLTIGCAITFCTFVWDTWEEMKIIPK